MDINICVDRLGLNANTYRLTQSPTPHEIIEWLGPDPQPVEIMLQQAWDAYLAETTEEVTP